MEKQPLFTLTLPPNVSGADREELLVELRKAGGIVQEETRRDLATVILILTIVKLSAEILKLSIELAEKIVAWRKKSREEGKELAGELQRPGKESLDLAKASDEEIREWMVP